MKTLFFGDGPWATNSLKRLIEEGLDIIGVVVRTLPTDSELLSASQEHGLPLYQPSNVNEATFVSKIRQLNPDLCLSVSYDQILRHQILGVPPLGFINFHAGRLPFYRGRNVINWAIINGETEVGLTAHYVDEGVDTGDIILQRTVGISREEGYAEVLAKVQSELPALVVETVKLVSSGEFQSTPQRNLPGTYFPARSDGDEWIDWSERSEDIYNKIRAITHPGPGARTVLGDQIVTIWKAFYDPTWPNYKATPGQVVGRVPSGGVMVKTGDSTLHVSRVQVDQNAEETPTWRIGIRLGFNQHASFHNLLKRVEALESALANSTMRVRDDT